jgi:hypothetical protein
MGVFNVQRCKSFRIVSMCDDACCDFSGQEIQNQISHIDQPNRIGRCAIYPSCDFLAKSYKTRCRTSTNRTSRCAIYPSCDFLAQKDNTRHRIPTNRTESVDVRYVCIVIFWPRNTTPDIAHRPTEPNRSRCDMSVL